MSSGVITIVALLAFIAIVIWVFVIKRKEDFDEQAQLPLEDEERQRKDHPRSGGEGNDKENRS